MENSTVVFEEFARRAAKKMEERKKHKVETLHVGSVDMDIDIRGISDKEFADCSEFSNDPVETDKYLIFFASKTLQSAAGYLVQHGQLPSDQAYKITDMFTGAERAFIANRILKLSGVLDSADITVVKETEEIKNS